MKTRLRGILVAAVLLRVLLAAAALVVARSPAGFAIFAAGDTSKYVRLASSIAVHGRFEDEGLPEVFRTPGYPLLLTPGILAGDVYVFAVLMQVLVVVATVALVYETARLLYDEERIAWWCAALCAFEPTLLARSVRITPDAPLAMLVALAAYALISGVLQQNTMMLAG